MKIPSGVAGLFQKNEFGSGHGGATASLWLAGAISQPAVAPPKALDWRTRLHDWAMEIDLAPDLGQRIGTLEWFRGVLTCTALCGTALYLSPGIRPLADVPDPLMQARQFDEARAQMILPLALGGDSGRHMASTDVVSPLRETPERPQIMLTAAVGSGDSFNHSLERAGISDRDANTINRLLAGSVNTNTLKPGTRIDITLGRRPNRNVARPLDALAFRARLDLAVEITRVNGALTLNRIPIKVDDTPLRIRGQVGSSLYVSARAAGAPPKAIQAYLKAVANHISVSRDIAAGDTFDIIVDYRRAETGDVEVGELLYAGLNRARGKDLDLLKWNAAGRTEWFEASGVGQRRGELATPVSGRMSSGYGMRRHPILGFRRMHAGLDFAARYGTPIYAATDGTVAYSGRHGGHGNYVRINHGNGLATGYAHMSRIATSYGARVRRGQVIGYVGSTGLSTGPHLHYELYRNGRTVNPLSVKFATTAQLSGKELASFRARLSQLKSLQPGIRQPSAPVQNASAASPMPDTNTSGSAIGTEIAFRPDGSKQVLR